MSFNPRIGVPKDLSSIALSIIFDSRLLIKFISINHLTSFLLCRYVISLSIFLSKICKISSLSSFAILSIFTYPPPPFLL